ncbi:MAG: ABC transporter substrate-binding protein [Chloroflexi bacterium]|nr:ABC transporter substrate-binding protein [Chloroflexota bacterium]
MDARRRWLIRGLGLGALGMLGSGCDTLNLPIRIGRDTRRIGGSLVISPAWPPLLIDVTSDLAALHQKYFSSTENFRWGLADDPSELAQLVQGQVSDGVILLLPLGAQAIQAAAAATSSVPIVGILPGDGPDTSALERLIKPGGNVTGVASVATPPERQLETFRRARPDARRVGLLWHAGSTWPAETPMRLTSAASGLGLELMSFELKQASDLPDGMRAVGQANLSGLLLLPEWLTGRLFPRVVEQAKEARVPLIAPARRFTELGALLSLGPSFSLLGRGAADLISKILDGATPGSLPMQRVNDTELAVNPPVARQLGFTLPRELVAQAQSVVREGG